MRLTPRGALFAWFGITAVIVGAVFQYTALVGVALTALALLAIRTAYFRYNLNRLRKQLSLRIEPETSTTLVEAFFKFEVSLSNSSVTHVMVTDLKLVMPTEIKADTQNLSKRQLLPRKASLHYTILAQATAPGLFKVSSATLTLEDRSTLLTDTLRLRCYTVIEASPRLAEPEMRIETSDPRRLGPGTEVAGLREAVTDDDFRAIDWKSTARTGRFIAKEFSRELTPPAIIVVDKTTLRQSASQIKLLPEIARLLVSFGPSTQVGLVIFDDRSVIAQFSPSIGNRIIGQMINTLVTASGEEAKSTPSEVVTRSYSELINLVQVMKPRMRSRSARTIDVYTRSVLPYYENALSNYPSKLRRQGSFQALMNLSKLQPALIIVIISPSRDLSGICEGSVILNQISHRVAIALVSNQPENIPPELSRLRQLGILVLQSSDGSELLAKIRAEVRNAPRIRTENIKPPINGPPQG